MAKATFFPARVKAECDMALRVSRDAPIFLVTLNV